MQKNTKILIAGSAITIGVVAILIWYTQNAASENLGGERLGKPTNLQLQLTPNAVQLYISWNAPTTGGAVTKYYLYRNGQLVQSNITKPSTSDFFDILKPGVYEYQVSAINIFGNESEKSDAQSILKS